MFLGCGLTLLSITLDRMASHFILYTIKANIWAYYKMSLNGVLVYTANLHSYFPKLQKVLNG